MQPQNETRLVRHTTATGDCPAGKALPRTRILFLEVASETPFSLRWTSRSTHSGQVDAVQHGTQGPELVNINQQLLIRPPQCQ